MNNRPDFFMAHKNRTKGKVNPCHKCTTEIGRYPGCHDHCEKHIAWKAPDEPPKQEYFYEHTDKRNLVKGLSGGRV